ncbi:hypothetical protein SAMN02745126_02906 [Enhydrobacter aerosaccus]|uniref:Uncharacterized protein n=1 Tax=Enhydrobacter aerosaccus TaxID=225324 RepID=A0A1T4PMJ0_9HYPH|nr:hypothetical protein [Enhydrobacter aerosaccus]SJZ92699.1 hypothetical protein SAMN02745126_02906 [Enhydrobacter aerosaccus]
MAKRRDGGITSAQKIRQDRSSLAEKRAWSGELDAHLIAESRAAIERSRSLLAKTALQIQRACARKP